jgi:hypothetical protein
VALTTRSSLSHISASSNLRILPFRAREHLLEPVQVLDPGQRRLRRQRGARPAQVQPRAGGSGAGCVDKHHRRRGIGGGW